jgi:hypothetical protein
MAPMNAARATYKDPMVSRITFAGILSRRSALLLCLLVGYLVIGLFSALTLASHDYETEYLALGNLVVRGEISLYQDELRGHWPPLPFYVYGILQTLTGPSLLSGRLLACVIGALVLALVFLLATRWAGSLAGATAAALFCSHGLLIGYVATVHFAGLVALLILVGLYVLYGAGGSWRPFVAMGIFAVLFLVKNNYWPAIPFVLALLLSRPQSARARVALIAIALAIPAAFFASDPRHLKMLAYVPVLQRWVEPLGYHPWYMLTEDAGQIAASDYADIVWEFSVAGRLKGIAGGLVFLGRRYAIWLVLLALAAGIALWRSRDWRAAARLWSTAGVATTFWLFWYLAGFQFIVLGPYAKQAVGFVGAVAPLLAVAIGCLMAVVMERFLPSRPVRKALLALLVLAVLASPWIHRHHNLPRRVSLADGPIATLPQVAAQLATLLPAGESRIFGLADPMPIYLAGRRTYLRQFNQERWGFTSLRDRERYARVGMWGPAEIEEWLGKDARYAVVESDLVQFYRNRPLYREALARVDILLAQNFTLLGKVDERPGDTFSVYRRNAPSAYGDPDSLVALTVTAVDESRVMLR